MTSTKGWLFMGWGEWLVSVGQMSTFRVVITDIILYCYSVHNLCCCSITLSFALCVVVIKHAMNILYSANKSGKQLKHKYVVCCYRIIPLSRVKFWAVFFKHILTTFQDSYTENFIFGKYLTTRYIKCTTITCFHHCLCRWRVFPRRWRFERC